MGVGEVDRWNSRDGTEITGWENFENSGKRRIRMSGRRVDRREEFGEEEFETWAGE